VTEVKQLTSHFNGLLATLQDYNHQLEDLSVKDPLTGLLNRRKFEEVVEFELQRSRRQSYQLCLVFIDLDNFKQINDTQGHPVGDLLLREVAKVLSGMLRASDIIARMGGDEFAILMPDTTRVQGLSVAEKLRQSLSATNINLPDGPTRVLGSFGLVASPDNGEEVSALFTAMDVAMYKAKRTGKNRVVSFDADDHEAVRDVYNQSEDIRRSLVEDRIEVYYQPICDLTNGALLGYEALARVRHGKALVDAAQFIHVAEQVGLVEEIDLRVFKKVLEHKRNFPLNGIPIFVNISERTISNGERIRHMMTLTEEAAVVPSEIVFEFAERDALPHLSMLRELTEDLHRVGFGVALDDFGSGFSSFLNLKYLHVTYVKMEGSLVKHVHMDEKNRVMIDHFNQIAIKFNIRALAKLVEDADTARVVAELGISAGQGFHVGAPKDIDATVRDQRERGRTI
jgi:diguanylate cyclase (GGDEF)-like protein